MNSATRELVIEPNMHYKRDLLDMFDETKPELTRAMTSTILVERRNMFRNGLLDIVKDCHEEFLASINITADRTLLTSWHKDFNLDSMVPDIDLADLPPNPDIVEADTRVVRADHDYINIVNSDTVNKNTGTIIAPSPSKFLLSPVSERKYYLSPGKAGLEGVNPDIVSRIMAKEANKAKLEMTRTQAQIDRIALLRKLPKLARLVKNLFVSENKAALPLEFTCKKLVDSLQNGLDKKEIERDLRKLSGETEGWLHVCTVRATEYCKIEKVDINHVCKKLNTKLTVALES